MTAKLKLLVVDAHRDSADSLVELFRLEGHVADVAYDGAAGVAAYRGADYDLAFMDSESHKALLAFDPSAKAILMTGHSVEQLFKSATSESGFEMVEQPSGAGAVVAAVDGLKSQGIVLVAEDDPDLGPELQQLIQDSGRRCEIVTNGQQALDRVARGGVDVLVLDLNMPLINGIEVYAQLSARSMGVPTVMITACSDMFRFQLDAMADLERTGILHKPFDPSQLLARLEKLAAKKIAA
jgi:DNA-binding response OmpR family regulator